MPPQDKSEGTTPRDPTDGIAAEGNQLRNYHAPADDEIPEVTVHNERLTKAKASRSAAKSLGQSVSAEVLGATRQIYQQLIAEGQSFLEEAKRTSSLANAKYTEVQRKLEEAESARAEANEYLNQAEQEVGRRADKLLKDAQAEAEEACQGIRVTAENDLERARLLRASAETYREKIIADASNRAEHIESEARVRADKECLDILRRVSLEAEAIRAAAREEYKTMKIYAEAAMIEAGLEDQFSPPAPSEAPSPGNNYLAISDAIDQDSREEEIPEFHLPLADLSLAHTKEDEEDVLGELESDELDFRHTHQPEYSPYEAQAGTPAKLGSSDELGRHKPVLGLALGGLAKAYPMGIITAELLIHDHFSGRDILVTLGKPGDNGAIFDRALESRTLTFQPWPEDSDDLVFIRDRETGTVWEALTGYAVAGPLLGNALHPIPGESAMLFHWMESHPETQIHGNNSTDSAS